MTTTEQALKASSGPVLPETLADRTGRPVGDTLVDLSILSIQGKAEEVGGRWKWKGEVAATPKASRAKAKKGSKKPPVMVQGRPQVAGAGEVKRKGKGWTAKRGAGKGTAAPYPVKVCSTRFKDPETGRWARTPKDVKAATTSRARTRKGKTEGGLILMRKKVDGEVLGARVVDPTMRAAQRRGKVTKAQVREHERGLSGDLLAHSNPRLAASVDSERMHAAHNSDKAKRGAATRKAKAKLKKHRPEASIRADALKLRGNLAEVRRKLSVASTPRQKETLRKREANLREKQRKLERESKAAGFNL